MTVHWLRTLLKRCIHHIESALLETVEINAGTSRLSITWSICVGVVATCSRLAPVILTHTSNIRIRCCFAGLPVFFYRDFMAAVIFRESSFYVSSIDMAIPAEPDILLLFFLQRFHGGCYFQIVLFLCFISRHGHTSGAGHPSTSLPWPHIPAAAQRLVCFLSDLDLYTLYNKIAITIIIAIMFNMYRSFIQTGMFLCCSYLYNVFSI